MSHGFEIARRPDLIPVLTGSRMDLPRPALGDITCTGSAPTCAEQLRESVNVDRRHSTTVTVDCMADEETCCTGTSHSRWLPLARGS